LTSRGLFAFCWPFWIGCAIGQILLIPFGIASLDMFLGMCAGCMCPYLSRKFSSANVQAMASADTQTPKDNGTL
jgi:hypothetical protein